MARYATTARQRDVYGGTNWGAAFFGWLVAVGIGALLTAFLSAAGTSLALSEFETVGEASNNAETIGIVGGILIIAVALISYFAGGYVAGRMSRFSGPKQGLGVWIIALVVTVILAVAGAVLGAQYNVLSQLNLPRIPIDEGSLTTGGIIALVAVVLVTLLAAVSGGKVGERFHRKVDRVGL